MFKKSLGKAGITIALAVLFLSVIACGSTGTSTQSPSAEPSEPEASAVSEKATESQVEQSTETPLPEPTAPAIGKIGDRIVSGGLGIAVVSVQTINSLGILQADAGKTYLDVEVIIENADRNEQIPYNPLYFKVKDSEGQEFTTAMMSLEPSLKSGDLNKGEKARGHVAFEIMENSQGLVLSYEPMVLFGDYKEIRVDLSQKSDAPAEVQEVVPVKAGSVGQQVVSAGLAITVTAVSNPPSFSNGIMVPGDGNKYIDIEVVIENVSREEPTPYNPLYFKIKDDQNYEYSSAMLSLEPSLKSGDLNKGDKVKGHVAFEVKQDAKGLVVSYVPLVLFSNYEPINISLGQ